MVLSSLIVAASLLLSVPPTDLRASFANPPAAARPWVYWFWLNGNVTREGITADLEAMKRVGIGGALIMEVDQGVPLGPVPFAGPKWRELFHHVVTEAGRLGLEINMNDDAGWNGSGGPWITPDVAMQKLVWSETTFEGGKPVEVTLPQPATVGGYYRDEAVIAVREASDFRIPNLEAKSALVRGDVPWQSDRMLKPPDAIGKNEMFDLTSAIDPTRPVKVGLPEGKWTVLRFGRTLTGAENAPAPASGRGLECDKLSDAGSQAAFAGLIGKLAADSRGLIGKSLVRTHIDSWENHSQNWTPLFRQEFRRLRGYDLAPWLPVMTGRVVGSLDQSERFLWDVRRTVADLVQSRYASGMRKLANKSGLRLSIEGYGDCVMDDMAYAGRADEPMAEFWSWPGNFTAGTVAQMVSAAHVYGKPIVGAEAFTATDGERWRHHPASIKALGDWAFCEGINRFVFHRYAMQPWLDVRPGMGMGPWGIHYERTQTWWEWTGPWHAYLSRCQYLMRQGKPVVDLLYVAPEGAPSAFAPPANHGLYRADACPAEVVLDRLSVRDGLLVLPDGMSYRALVLSGAPMTPELLARVEELVEDGAAVIGPRPPEQSPSLSGYPRCDDEASTAVRRLWDGHGVKDAAPDRCLAARGVPPDFEADRPLGYGHRRIGEVDAYFVSNPEGRALNARCLFRVAGRVAELWDPEKGAVRPLPSRPVGSDRTAVQLFLNATQSAFVVFRPAKAGEATLLAVEGAGPAASAGPSAEVIRATWGPAGDATRTKDVTAFVRRKVSRGQAAFPVLDLVATGDPAYGTVKTLTVEYAVGGKKRTARATDPERLTLDVPGDQPPPVQVVAPGLLAARRAGAYTVQTARGEAKVRAAAPPRPVELGGVWTLRVPGAKPMALTKLTSWSEMAPEAVRYFSGTARYERTFVAPAAYQKPGRRVWLDLGRVEVMARVKLNGRDLGLLWKAPFRCDATSALRKGANRLEVEVVNLWPNRLIGDERLPADSDRNPDGTLRSWPGWLLKGQKSPTGRTTFATWRQYGPNDPLLPSGLLGPVRLEAETLVCY